MEGCPPFRSTDIFSIRYFLISHALLQKQVHIYLQIYTYVHTCVVFSVAMANAASRMNGTGRDFSLCHSI